MYWKMILGITAVSIAQNVSAKCFSSTHVTPGFCGDVKLTEPIGDCLFKAEVLHSSTPKAGAHDLHLIQILVSKKDLVLLLADKTQCKKEPKTIRGYFKAYCNDVVRPGLKRIDIVTAGSCK